MKKSLAFLLVIGYLAGCKQAEIPISDETPIEIPDAAFEQYLIFFGIDSDQTPNGFIRYKDVRQADTLNLIVMGHLPVVKSLKGIEYFVNLKYLNCSGFGLDELDMSHNAQLEYLDCSTTPSVGEGYFPPAQIKQLLFGPVNNRLKILRCRHNGMQNLDLSSLSNLQELICTGSSLTELDLSQNKQLSLCWTYASPQLQTIYVSSLNQIDTSRVTSGFYNGSMKWAKDYHTTYRAR